MISVSNEANPFESAAVSAVWEQMVTACNMPASATSVLGTQTSWTAWSCTVLGSRLRQLLQKLGPEGTWIS